MSLRTRIALLCLLLAGCHTTGISYNFPSDISNLCYGCRNDAKERLMSKGAILTEYSGCGVVKHPGTKNVNGSWAWYYEPLNVWVYGICSGSTIDVGCNPTTGQEINVAVLTHEMAHYWLMSNYNDYTHNAKYDGLFLNWKASRDACGFSVEIVQARYQALTKGQTMSLDFVDKGRRYTVDCVKP